MRVVGIDPGMTGGIAVIDGDAARVFAMPTLVVKVGKKLKRRLDTQALARLLTEEALGHYAFVEYARASPQMGVTSAFAYGQAFGLVLGVLARAGTSTTLVTADKWKRAMGLVRPGSRELGSDEARANQGDKSPSLDLARRLYPQLAADLARQKDDGKAEALLICHYGCEVLEEEASGPLFARSGRKSLRQVMTREMEF